MPDMMNASEYNTNSSEHEDCSISHNVVDVLVPSLYFLIFIPALVLNITVIWVLLQLKTESTFMVYLKNLVAADLIMTLTMPIKAASKLPGAALGLAANKLPGAALGLRAFTCRFANVLFYTSMYISIVLMGLISLDRFFKIVRPCGSLFGQNLLFGRTVSVAAWMILLSAASLPTMIMTSQTPTRSSPWLCMEMKSPMGRDFHRALIRASNALFWVVLILIGFCYTCIARAVVQSYTISGSTNRKRKRKTEAKVFIVLVVFLVCFTPYHIVRIPYTELQVKNEHSCIKESLKVAKDFTLWLSTTNVCLDPLIYFFLCRGFREKLSHLGRLGRFTSSWLRDH